MIVSSALMIWKGLMVVTSSESPIVVVLRYQSPKHLFLSEKSNVTIKKKKKKLNLQWKHGTCISSGRFIVFDKL